MKNQRFHFSLLLCFLIGAIGVAPLMADSSIDAGAHSLLPNLANQPIEIYVVGDDQVRGMNVRAQIGDGAGPESEPIFEDADFTEGIWDAHPSTVLGGVVGDGQYMQSGIAFDEANKTVASDGQIVRLSISTVGINEGRFPLLLAGTDIGEDTDFIVVGGDEFVPEIVNGTITIVPEPGALALLLVGTVIALMRGRGRRRPR